MLLPVLCQWPDSHTQLYCTGQNYGIGDLCVPPQGSLSLRLADLTASKECAKIMEVFVGDVWGVGGVGSHVWEYTCGSIHTPLCA